MAEAAKAGYEAEAMKRCGLYIRVSTDRQAKVEEGSLKNQDHLLTQHVELKSKLGQEQWVIVERYVDEGRSAKDTKNRPAYLRMIEDAKQGRINTVLCVALSRISRSTRDLLDMIEFFKQHDVDFICLKEDFDTTTAQGKCFVTIMGALNEFEREQTAERTRAAFLARAERGLWNGGHLFGYDLDTERKGYLRVNEQEAAVVNFAFETYLKTGSVLRTRDALNVKGCRTKTYTSRRGKLRHAAPFSHGGVYQLLTNYAYVGKKEINKKLAKRSQEQLPAELRYRIVDAVWPAVVPEQRFYEAQRLLQQNFEAHNNYASPTKHFYLLNGGWLYCHRCGSQMEGRNGHGHKGQKTYYYYFCKNRACRFKLPQAEIEWACAALVQAVAEKDDMVPKIAAKFNNRLKAYLPRLSVDRKRIEGELREVNAEAQAILTRAEGVEGGRVFVQERLKELADRRRHLEGELERLRVETAELDTYAVDEARVRQMLEGCQAMFGEDMQPYKRRELLRAALQRIEFSDSLCRAGLKLSPALLDSARSSGTDSLPDSTRGASLDSNLSPLR
jgi:site-specific DNA recombinase